MQPLSVRRWRWNSNFSLFLKEKRLQQKKIETGEKILFWDGVAKMQIDKGKIFFTLNLF